MNLNYSKLNIFFNRKCVVTHPLCYLEVKKSYVVVDELQKLYLKLRFVPLALKA